MTIVPKASLPEHLWIRVANRNRQAIHLCLGLLWSNSGFAPRQDGDNNQKHLSG